MIEITKPGKEPYDIKKFVCRNCECEFTADKDDYLRRYGTRNILSADPDHTYIAPWETTVAICPHCGDVVKIFNIRLRPEENI